MFGSVILARILAVWPNSPKTGSIAMYTRKCGWSREFFPDGIANKAKHEATGHPVNQPLTACGLIHPRLSGALDTPSRCSDPKYGADRFIRAYTTYWSAQPDTEISLGPKKNPKVLGTKFGWIQLEAGDERGIGAVKILDTHKNGGVPVPEDHAKS
ncbi:hypothetical protein DFH06DRAFT_1295752 [Mycena polygramma]|nr:hypothetical protein DFH06DRAFT_1295752 [Mycena polygramma]